MQINPGSTLDLSAGASGSSADFLIHNGTTSGSLNLGANNFTVTADYTNASFGVGNAFDKRANVAGAGQILAGLPFMLSTTGSLAFGNVHVGDTPSLGFTVDHNGIAGTNPQLRAVIQTAANGGNITDARLSGAGVTASNLLPIVSGASSASLGVTFTANTAGALTGQQVHIESNFDNVAGVNVVVSGAAFRFANPTAHTPEPINFGNFHVGDTAPSQLLSITNNVPADGFSEFLNASIGSATGGVTTNSGTFNLLAAGATNSTSLGVDISTASAGSKNGTATISLTSDGTGTSGLGTTALTAQTVNVNGAVFRLAAASAHTPEPVNFGVVHIGETPSQALALTNTATNDAFSEKLDASFSATTGDATAAGSFSLLNAQGTNNSSLSVGVNTASAGSKTGTATIALASNGAGTSGLGTTALSSQTVNMQGQVNFFADPRFVLSLGSGIVSQNDATTFTLDFGQVVQNTGIFSASLGVLNFLHDATFQDTLGGTFSTGTVTNFSLTGFVPFSGTTSGSSHGTGVSFDSAMAFGTYTDSLTLNPTSTNASTSTGQNVIQLNLRGEIVPEPGSILLLAIGGGLMLGRRRRSGAH